jgi:hypothetical protein
LRGFQEVTDARDSAGPRLAPIAQVKDKPWVAHDLASETGGRDLAETQEILDFS